MEYRTPKTMSQLEEENEKLRMLAKGMLVCENDYAEANNDCPLYDESEPYRCKRDRLMRELGIGKESNQ